MSGPWKSLGILTRSGMFLPSPHPPGKCYSFAFTSEVSVCFYKLSTVQGGRDVIPRADIY